MNRFQLLLDCYVSGQMTDADWEWHLETDEMFKAWFLKRTYQIN